jgi:hypothetical protein
LDTVVLFSGSVEHNIRLLDVRRVSRPNSICEKSFRIVPRGWELVHLGGCLGLFSNLTSVYLASIFASS